MSRPAVVIEPEKRIPLDTELVETLVSSLKDAFTTANELYQKLKEFQTDFDDPKHSWRGSLYAEDTNSDRRQFGRRERWRSRSRSKGRKDVEFRDVEAFEMSGNRGIVKDAFRKGYDAFGEKFANGDLLAQSQLQTAIMTIQHAVIAAFQTCCWVNRIKKHEIVHHLAQLHGATSYSRQKALNAMTKLSERLSAGASSDRSSTLLPYPEEDINMTALAIRSKSPSRERSRLRGQHGAHEAYHVFPHKAYEGRAPKVPNSIFCPYARDLQNDLHQPVSDDFKAEGDGRCPYCRFYISIRPGGLWAFSVTDGRGRKQHSQTTFEIGNRFVIKSHRDGGSYACVLCARYRKEDTTCREIRALIEHVREEHPIAEIESDIDIVEVV
ncbi:hypothetical protein BDV96DRAFT_652170 [Lophiotrema nucula]|uniref:Uncharacterized protein n=1 Tax=Lophiotrema nucula TaxID=690887 RepID=A0A6A5YQE4_9PLEO|nr:hypothetical protein BDV96DRAFT_652170 [Lophiotrema nucula]